MFTFEKTNTCRARVTGDIDNFYCGCVGLQTCINSSGNCVSIYSGTIIGIASDYTCILSSSISSRTTFTNSKIIKYAKSSY